MKTKPLFAKSLSTAILLSLVLTWSCHRSVPKEPEKAMEYYISGTTSGIIPAGSSINVHLAIPVSDNFNLNQPLADGIFRLKPEVQGKAYLISKQSIRFIPDNPLLHGQTYEAMVSLAKLYPEELVSFPKVTFSFDVIELDFKLGDLNLIPYSNRLLNWNKLEGSIITSDVVSMSLIENWLRAEMNGKALPVTWDNSSMPPMYKFTIDSVERIRLPQTIEMTWTTPASVKNERETEFDVPPLDEFKLVGISTESDPDQAVILTFTDPINSKQSVDGLVYFKDQKAITLSIENNTIRVIPNSRMMTDQVLIVSAGLENSMGVKLSESLEKVVHFEPALPEVKFAGNGNILPGDQQWNIPFEVRNLTAVDVTISKIYTNNILQFLQVNSLNSNYELYRVGEQVYDGKYKLDGATSANTWDYSAYALDLTQLIKTEPGAIYQVQLSFSREDIVYPCISSDNDDDDYYWRHRNNPCKKAFYYSYNDHFASKNILATNLGVVVKNSGNSLKVWVNNILTTNPESRVKVQLYSFQQQLLGEALTNDLGESSIGVDPNTTPSFLVATKGNQSAYLKLDDGLALSYSKFDTRGQLRQSGLQGFIYGERGVWRPGDTLFLSLIVQDRPGVIPDIHPVTIELSNPKGKVVQTKTVEKGQNGFYCFTLLTSAEAETGLYYAVAKMGNATFSKTLRIENIKPNRLKIELAFPDSLLTSKKNEGEISSRWLSGGAAADFEANIEATFKPQKTSFKGFEGYSFNALSRNFYPETQTVFNDKLNSDGKAEFTVDLPQASRAPGMIGVSFFTKVMEKGGDFSVNQKNMTYSPFTTYVGVRPPEVLKGSEYLEVDKPVTFDVVTVDAMGQLVSTKGLEVSVYKLDWSWWYGNDGQSNLAGYLSSNYNARVLSKTIETVKGKAHFSLELRYPAWGWYYAEILDPESGHATGIRFYMDWPSYYSRDQREAPGDVTHLSLSTDRSKYEVGDSVHLTMDLPPNARLLVSIESADTILQSWQQTTDKKETVVSFIATENMVPNIYASVMVWQPYAQSINDLPVRMYGLANVLVDNPSSILNPIISGPEQIKPNTDYTLRISEKMGRKMTYTLAVVDDGLLDLTNFATPDPHRWFYAKEALSVKTWDDYDDILGAFGGRILNTMAVGGDGSEEDSPTGDKKANRFKPVVSFLGPYTLESGQETIHKLHMPNYIGSVRCMVVAANQNAFGNTQKTIAVKQPLMVLATVPRVLGPGETLKMPVSVFAMEDHIKNVEVKVKTNGLFELTNPIQKLTFEKPGEKLAWFEVKVNEMQGIGTIHVEVSGGGASAYYDVELNVRNPNTMVSVSTQHRLLSGQDSSYQVPSVGLPDTRELSMTVSSIFPINLERRLKYLVRYPYGCSEQLVSGAFPQLYLSRFASLSNREKEVITQNIIVCIQKLGSRQRTDGGFVYWPGYGAVNDWVTSYVGNFLFLAREQGYPVTQSMLDKWISYQTKAANGWMSEKVKNYYLGDANQGYRLYTLALAHRPALSAMNRMAEMKNLSAEGLVHLAGAYALSGQPDMAKKLLREASPDVSARMYAYTDGYGSMGRDKAFQLLTYLLLDDQNSAFKIYEQLAKELGSNIWMSTQTTAFALYAVSEFIGDQPADAPVKYEYRQGLYQSGSKLLAAPLATDSLDAQSNNQVRITNQSQKALYVTFTASGIPAPSQEVLIEDNLWLDLSYYDMNNRPLDAKSLKQGQDFYLKAVVRNSRLFGRVSNLALSIKMPSGWEIINTRLFDVGADLKNSSSDYMDIKDDGIDWFFDLGTSQSKQFFVLLHATYAGTYFMPASTCEAMYNNDIKAAKGGGWIVVNPGE